MTLKRILFIYVVALCLTSLAIGGCIMAVMSVYAQDIPGHETIEYSMVVTYIGPKDAITFDTEFIQDTMRTAPIIYCEGDFTFQTIIDNDKRIEIVCTYDWSADGMAGH